MGSKPEAARGGMAKAGPPPMLLLCRESWSRAEWQAVKMGGLVGAGWARQGLLAGGRVGILKDQGCHGTALPAALRLYCWGSGTSLCGRELRELWS